MTALIPLEDSWSDVIRKARRGLGLTEMELARRSGVQPETVMALEGGALDLTCLAELAEPLGLHQCRLLALARGEYHPGSLELPRGMARFTTPWNDFEVHSYLLWDEQSSMSAAFDTGSDASPTLEYLASHSLALGQIFLTHGHGDHVFELDRLVEKTGANVWIGDREQVPGAKHFTAGSEFSVGSSADHISIETRSTWGHSVGGISYVIHGLERPVAIVGDALFAGSIGGPMISYAACLETNRHEILSLPPETLLCPGHGPLTTVGQELASNPFFT